MSRFTSHARSSLPAFVALALYACSLQDFEYLQEGEAGASSDAGKGGKGGTAGANGGSSGSGASGGSGGNGGTPNPSGGAPGEEAGQGGQAGTVGASGEAGAPAGGTSAGTTSAGGAPPAGQAGEGGVPNGAGGDPIVSGGSAGEPASEGGAGGQPPLVGNLLVNPGFDLGSLAGWTVDPPSATASRHVYTQTPSPANNTASSLAFWHMTDEYEVFIYQTVTGLEPGTYTLQGQFSTTSVREAYLFARCGAEGEEEETIEPIPLDGFAWFPVVIQSFAVTATRCEVGIFVHGLAPEGGTPDWLNADLFSFEKDL